MSYKLKNIKYSPLKGLDRLTVTSGFGARSFYNTKTKKQQTDFHSGIDLIGGTTIVATFAGKVISCQSNIKGFDQVNTRGNFIIIEHENNVQTAYYHIKFGTLKVKIGDKIESGMELGVAGSTGNATGVHLHYGVKVNSNWVNPVDYLLGNKTIIGEEKMVSYVIKKGDTLSGIAFKFNTTVDELVKLNNIDNPNLIIAGKTLKISEINKNLENENKTYVVKKNDNLSSIAKKYNKSWQTIYELNKDVIGPNPNLIRPGQILKIE